jgi:nucleoside-diphosphate-sugar epimerase
MPTTTPTPSETAGSMPDTPKRIFVTGATGLVGSHVVEEAVARGHDVRALVRASSDTTWLDRQGVGKIVGDLQDESALRAGVRGADWVINCAAMVGDWGKLDDFRVLNVDALRLLLDAAAEAGVARFGHVSSLGVYEGRDHFGTDENTPPAINSLDAYTRSKTEAEVLALLYTGTAPVSYGGTPVNFPYVDDQLARSRLSPDQRRLAVSIVRPGFIYGERDRTVLPKLVDALRRGRFMYFGSGEQALNCIYVKNLVQAIFLAAERPEAVGEVFNITDGRRVSKQEFVGRVAELAGLPRPRRHLPLGVARVLAKAVEAVAKARGAKKPPLINKARFKFLGLNLDYSVEKARRVLGYEPAYSTEEGLVAAMSDFMGRLAPAPAPH